MVVLYRVVMLYCVVPERHRATVCSFGHRRLGSGGVPLCSAVHCAVCLSVHSTLCALFSLQQTSRPD
jgi:hypothetical protein